MTNESIMNHLNKAYQDIMNAVESGDDFAVENCINYYVGLKHGLMLAGYKCTTSNINDILDKVTEISKK